MQERVMSCIDCGVKNCDKMDKTYPDFCLTTNMDPGEPDVGRNLKKPRV